MQYLRAWLQTRASKNNTGAVQCAAPRAVGAAAGGGCHPQAERAGEGVRGAGCDGGAEQAKGYLNLRQERGDEGADEENGAGPQQLAQ